jgi:cytochrome c oxidase assembly factor CtaG
MIGIGNLWDATSAVWFAALGILIAYVWLIRRAPATANASNYVALGLGLTLLLLAFISPIGTLADGYVFSAHMIQHLFLLLLVPLCLILAVPRATVEPLFKRARWNRLGYWLAVPLLGWILGVGAMWFWHVPSLCNVSTQNASVGGFRDTTFVLAGLAFWWPIYAPLPRYRMAPLPGIAYLFSACLGCTLLGIYITFTTISVCPAFAHPVGHAAVMQELRASGFTPEVDQHLGGLLMWVPPCTLYVANIIALLCRWYSEGTSPETLSQIQRTDRFPEAASV